MSSMEYVKIRDLTLSKIIVGSNPFSGNSHQGPRRDMEMRHYYTTARIKEVLKRAENQGINTILARGDHHIMRILMEYWDEGGGLQWFAQTCPELGPIERGIDNAIFGGAKACYIHGGVMDFLYTNKKLDEVPAAIEKIKNAGMPAGIAAHNPEVLEWAEENIDVDFYMCSYYNPTSRDKDPEHRSSTTEWFRKEDRDTMVEIIKKLGKPAIHYKVMAAGRNEPEEALGFAAKHLRPQDAVCIGVFTKDNPGMLEDDISLLRKHLASRSAC